MTQEELAEALYVSRTAISKWESGRGYPNIESLKDIATYFSVSIDDLLSGEKVLSMAEKENKENLRRLCDLLFSVVDLCSLLLMVLPLYPYNLGEQIVSVNLFVYEDKAPVFRFLYVGLFGLLMAVGIVKLIQNRLEKDHYRKQMTCGSIILGIITVFVLALTRETYAVTVAFVLLVVKVMLVFESMKQK